MQKGNPPTRNRLNTIKKGKICKIESFAPDFIYLLHGSNMPKENIDIVFEKGICHEFPQIDNTFCTFPKDATHLKGSTLEEIVKNYGPVNHYNYCFLYKMPRAILEEVEGLALPLPLWRKLTRKEFIELRESNPRTKGWDEDGAFALQPKLLFGYYDVKNNKFHKNTNWSLDFDIEEFQFDVQQTYRFDNISWAHNSAVKNRAENPVLEILQNNKKQLLSKYNVQTRRLI